LSVDRPDSVEEQPPADERSAPKLTAADRIFVRMSLWQTVLSVAGVFIAVVALYAALKESAAVRQQTAAAVWPFVQLLIEDYDSGDSARFAMSFMNVGVGPARLHAVRLELDGKPMRDWAQAVTTLGGDTTSSVSRNFISGRVLRPDEKVDMISTMEPDLARRFQAAIADPNNFIVYCYCSIFGECWVADSRRDLQDPAPVEICPDFGEAAFQN
jgi:hypothetical protein